MKNYIAKFTYVFVLFLTGLTTLAFFIIAWPSLFVPVSEWVPFSLFVIPLIAAMLIVGICLAVKHWIVSNTEKSYRNLFSAGIYFLLLCIILMMPSDLYFSFTMVAAAERISVPVLSSCSEGQLRLLLSLLVFLCILCFVYLPTRRQSNR